MPKFSTHQQAESKDSGRTCMKITAKHYGKKLSISQIRTTSENTREGSRYFYSSNAGETVGLRSLTVKLTLNEILKATLPCILYWKKIIDCCTFIIY